MLVLNDSKSDIIEIVIYVHKTYIKVILSMIVLNQIMLLYFDYIIYDNFYTKATCMSYYFFILLFFSIIVGFFRSERISSLCYH